MSQIKVGDIIGSYEVLERDITRQTAAKYWKVKCIQCGKEKTVRSDGLKKYNICKCQQSTLVGQTFGDFIVIEKTQLRAKDKCIIYQCQCRKCGHIENVASNVLRSNRKFCSKCHERNSTLLDLTGQTFNYLTVLKRDLSPEHIGHENDAYWICKCNNCGAIKSIRGFSLRNEITKSCGCVKSYGEQKIAEILSQNNIPFEREYKFDDLVYKDKLRFDFAIFQHGTLSHLVEYDGIQHFECRESGWNNEENLQEVQLRDALKNEYCKSKGIKLIRIKYDEEITLSKIMGEKDYGTNK